MRDSFFRPTKVFKNKFSPEITCDSLLRRAILDGKSSLDTFVKCLQEAPCGTTTAPSYI